MVFNKWVKIVCQKSLCFRSPQVDSLIICKYFTALIYLMSILVTFLNIKFSEKIFLNLKSHNRKLDVFIWNVKMSPKISL